MRYLIFVAMLAVAATTATAATATPKPSSQMIAGMGYHFINPKVTFNVRKSGSGTRTPAGLYSGMNPFSVPFNRG